MRGGWRRREGLGRCRQSRVRGLTRDGGGERHVGAGVLAGVVDKVEKNLLHRDRVGPESQGPNLGHDRCGDVDARLRRAASRMGKV